MTIFQLQYFVLQLNFRVDWMYTVAAFYLSQVILSQFGVKKLEYFYSEPILNIVKRKIEILKDFQIKIPRKVCDDKVVFILAKLYKFRFMQNGIMYVLNCSC